MAIKIEFRKWRRDGVIIALFPGPPSKEFPQSPEICDSYMHLSGPSFAIYRLVIESTEPATEAESAGLREELQALGYDLE